MFSDVPTKFQRCSYLVGRAPRMNTDVASKLKLLWLGSTKPPNFKKIGLAEILQIDFKVDPMFYT